MLYPVSFCRPTEISPTQCNRPLYERPVQDNTVFLSGFVYVRRVFSQVNQSFRFAGSRRRQLLEVNCIVKSCLVADLPSATLRDADEIMWCDVSRAAAATCALVDADNLNSLCLGLVAARLISWILDGRCVYISISIQLSAACSIHVTCTRNQLGWGNTSYPEQTAFKYL